MNDPDTTAAAFEVASVVHDGFDQFYAEFMALTRSARASFDAAAWARLHSDSQARIDLYQRHVRQTLERLQARGLGASDQTLWKQAHQEYAAATADRLDVEVAETFFNAITRKVFETVGVHAEIEFLDSDTDTDRHAAHDAPGLSRAFAKTTSLVALFEDVLRFPDPDIEWRDVSAAAQWLAETFASRGPVADNGGGFEHIEVRRVLFYRTREGYIVARVGVRAADSEMLQYHPVVIAVQPTPAGMVVDALLMTTEEILPVFASTRSYFFVDLDKPSDMVDFLASLMPAQTRSELYVSIAHHRHGKSLIYRELVEHLERSTDRFVEAPGIRGLVMSVFTLPSYRNVFKVIRDRFEKPATTREGVLASYRAVFRGQRAGRLADTQEFEHLAFDRDRFTDACIAELLSKAPSCVRVEGSRVIVDHCYIEEKMTPLNIYLQTASEAEACAAIVEYGDAIEELAAHNIFAGDLLWKNFGVNRSGQLVLYDYDEIQPLLDMKFRAVPEPRSWEEEMSAQPHYRVGENDVFPEEWRPFVVPRSPPAVREAFEAAHSDLLHPNFWRKMQRDLSAGRVRVNLPYRARHPELAAPVRARGGSKHR